MEGLILSGSPHIRGKASTRRIMLDVIIALIPACAAGVWFFGAGALVTVALSVGSAVLCEAAVQYFTKRRVTAGDLSAVLTGLLLALNLPPGVPWYLPVCGSAFAVIIVKQCFGGLGHNFVNPALAGRAFLAISWPVAMTAFLLPNGGADAVTAATPLASMGAEAAVSAGAYATSAGFTPELWDLFIGRVGGCIGETSVIALLAGAAYLLVRKVISIRIPAAYLGTVALFTLLTGHPELILFNLFAGGLMLGAFFMATDYVTGPMNKTAQVVFGVGCGVLTMVIRLWGGYPEGVSFSILIMNLFAPLLDRAFKTKVFGEVKRVEER